MIPSIRSVVSLAVASLFLAACSGGSGSEPPPPQCTAPSDCGAETGCLTRTCTGGVCGVAYKAVDTACAQDGGAFCSATGTCVACNDASQCPGSDTECQSRTCIGNVCGTSFASPWTIVSSQTSGDCQQNRCDGSGGVTSVALNSDVPADDGNQCTGETCSAGVPTHPPLPIDTACNQGGGSFCSATGTCVACNAPAQCPGSDTECQTRTCTANACGFLLTAAGTAVASQTAGDCQENQCNGSGSVVSVAKDSDLPADDGNPCTGEICSGGVPTHPPLPLGTACATGVCNGAGACIANAPAVATTYPADSSTVEVPTPVALTFTTAMNPATLTAQTSSGACSGTIQLSSDGFSSCASFGSAAPSMSGGDTVATLVPAPGLLVNRSYQLRVTTGATSAAGIAMASPSISSFSTTPPWLAGCGANVVISQVYGGGGNTGAPYKNDFVELHNRGQGTVDVAGWSVQYASASGTTWLVTPLSGTIAPGGYYLVQEAGGTVGAALPAYDVLGNTNMSATGAKVALVASTTALSGTCPIGSTVDFVGWGLASCFDGAAAAPATSNTTALFRGGYGCFDTNDDSADFMLAWPAPRNSASSALTCGCAGSANNESASPAEVSYCTVLGPQSMTVGTGQMTSTVYGQIYQAGITENAGPSAGVQAELGYGPLTANPEYEPGWSWIPAAYAAQVGTQDQYAAGFTAPAAGTWSYAYRFSIDSGASWTYCDANVGDGGAGSNVGLVFDLENLPALTVTP